MQFSSRQLLQLVCIEISGRTFRFLPQNIKMLCVQGSTFHKTKTFFFYCWIQVIVNETGTLRKICTGLAFAPPMHMSGPWKGKECPVWPGNRWDVQTLCKGLGDLQGSLDNTLSITEGSNALGAEHRREVGIFLKQLCRQYGGQVKFDGISCCYYFVLFWHSRKHIVLP